MLMGWAPQSGIVANRASVSRQHSSSASNAGNSICMLYIFVRHDAYARQQQSPVTHGGNKDGNNPLRSTPTAFAISLVASRDMFGLCS